MKQRPVVALVGRPNVGKSSLFNRFVGRRVAIVEDRPGVTRDRIYGECRWGNHTFTVVDTGGIDPYATEDIAAQSRGQAQIAVAEADVIVLVVDGREGIHALDLNVAELLRRHDKPVIVAVNKIDNPLPEQTLSVYEFYELGLGDPVPISAEHGRNTGELLDRIVEQLPEHTEDDDGIEPIMIAIVGRPNVGKSSLINALVGEERSIVSNVPGTTRDVVDTHLVYDDTPFILLDTAGLRRKSRIDTSVEHYSVVRAVRAVERCDVAVVVLDATEDVSEQDKRIIGIAHEAGKALVIAVNKWDLLEKDSHTLARLEKRYRSELAFVPYAEYVFISALTGQRVGRVLDLAKSAANFAALRLRTGRFNEVLQEAVSLRPPPSDKGVQPRIYYGFQARVKPPEFVLFCSHPERLHYSYVRYLENQVREAFGFVGTPIRFRLRDRRKS